MIDSVGRIAGPTHESQEMQSSGWVSMQNRHLDHDRSAGLKITASRTVGSTWAPVAAHRGAGFERSLSGRDRVARKAATDLFRGLEGEAEAGFPAADEKKATRAFFGSNMGNYATFLPASCEVRNADSAVAHTRPFGVSTALRLELDLLPSCAWR